LVAQDKQWTRPGKPIALIIGNANYPGVNTLCFPDGNCPPKNDAEDMEKALIALGFEVIRKTNLRFREMNDVIDDFGKKVRDGNYSVALVYFSGHGSEVKGKNYLYPIDATPKSASDTEFECINVNKVLGKLIDKKIETRILLLDACRDNPFEKAWNRSGTGSGLGYIDAADNTFIGFATKPNTTASNISTNGRNGLYTEAILKHIRTPNLTIDQVFTKVAKSVDTISVNNYEIKKQMPFKLSSLTTDFYFIKDRDLDGVVDFEDRCPDKFGSKNNNGCPKTRINIFIDPRDKQRYTWEKMKDGREWMTQNLNFKMSNSYCLEDDKNNCKKYGRLYDWATAKKACPSGWRLPSDDDWKLLAMSYGGFDDKGKDVGNPKTAYQTLVSGGDSGFKAVHGGYRFSTGKYVVHDKKQGYYWSASGDESKAWFYVFSKGYNKVFRYDHFNVNAFSCRCIKD